RWSARAAMAVAVRRHSPLELTSERSACCRSLFAVRRRNSLTVRPRTAAAVLARAVALRGSRNIGPRINGARAVGLGVLRRLQSRQLLADVASPYGSGDRVHRVGGLSSADPAGADGIRINP